MLHVLCCVKGVYAGLGEEKTPPTPASYPTPGAASFSSSLLATRYHSLVGDPATLPDCLVVTSYTPESAQPPSLTSAERSMKPAGEETKEGDKSGDDGSGEGRTIMGVRHAQYTVEGVQFHPESVTTEQGMRMLGNFLRLRGGEWKTATLV